MKENPSVNSMGPSIGGGKGDEAKGVGMAVGVEVSVVVGTNVGVNVAVGGGVTVDVEVSVAVGATILSMRGYTHTAQSCPELSSASTRSRILPPPPA
jgi:hypothetical protein